MVFGSCINDLKAEIKSKFYVHQLILKTNLKPFVKLSNLEVTHFKNYTTEMTFFIATSP